MTYTENGKTTLYGVVSTIKIVTDKMLNKMLFDETIYMRVATPDVLDWIKNFMKTHEK